MLHDADALASHKEDLAAGRRPPGWKPHKRGELAAIKKLMVQHPERSLAITRRDPGEKGPLLIHIIDGDTYQVARGKLEKVS
jgi:hypothetical protein